MSITPRLSVLLPVYNGAAYLRESIDSILSQDFRDFELIVINDGSTDDSREIAEGYQDARVRVINQDNIGLALTLRRGVELARAPIVARQDADDVSLPRRFSIQYQFLHTHPEVGLLGTWSRIVTQTGPTARRHAHPTTNGELQLRSLFDNFFVHSSVMFRRDVALTAGNYPSDPGRYPPEDFDLWSRIARISRLANIGEELLLYREVAGSISRSKAELIEMRVRAIAVENLEALLGGGSDRNVLHDLVCAVRLNAGLVRPDCDWTSLSLTVTALERALSARFPGDANNIRQAGKTIRQRLHRVRLLRYPLFGRGIGILAGLVRLVRY